jgi:hypothetical protein
MNSTTAISNDHKQWAKHLKELVGGKVSVTSYLDEPNENSIHIFSGVNDEGIVAATVGLMDLDQSSRSGVTIFSEVLMDQRGHDPRIFNILSTIAFCVIKDGWKVSPGAVFYDVVKMYVPDTSLPHVVFVAPFQWDTMSRIELPGKTIYPLVAIPISEAESVVAKANQGQDLETLWTQRSTDVLDWQRASAA